MLVESLIAQFCVSLSGVDYTACSKALEAAAIQVRVSQEIGAFENQLAKFTYSKAIEATSEKFITTAGLVTKIVRDKSISYPVLPEPVGVRPSVSGTIGVNGGSVTLGWQL